MVSIIILAFNKSNLLRECLSSISTYVSPKEAEVIVVDNASSDDTVAMIKKEFPSVRLLENTYNAGFAKGCNLGAKHAKGEYLLFLNSDAAFIGKDLSVMVNAFSKHRDAGIVGGLLVNHDGTLQRSAGDFYTLSHVVRLLFLGEKGELKDFDDQSVSVADWVSGGCMLVKKSVFEKMKGFNESYFMYIEDMDLCYRVKQAGFLTYIQPQVKVRHVGQGSGNRAFAIVHIYEGLQIFYKQQRSTLEYYMLKCILALKAIGVIIMAFFLRRKDLIQTYTKALKTL